MWRRGWSWEKGIFTTRTRALELTLHVTGGQDNPVLYKDTTFPGPDPAHCNQ